MRGRARGRRTARLAAPRSARARSAHDTRRARYRAAARGRPSRAARSRRTQCRPARSRRTRGLQTLGGAPAPSRDRRQRARVARPHAGRAHISLARYACGDTQPRRPPPPRCGSRLARIARHASRDHGGAERRPVFAGRVERRYLSARRTTRARRLGRAHLACRRSAQRRRRHRALERLAQGPAAYHRHGECERCAACAATCAARGHTAGGAAECRSAGPVDPASTDIFVHRCRLQSGLITSESATPKSDQRQIAACHIERGITGRVCIGRCRNVSGCACVGRRVRRVCRRRAYRDNTAGRSGTGHGERGSGALAALRAQFQWQRTSEGWEFDAERVGLRIGEREEGPPSEWRVVYRAADGAHALEVGYSRVRIEDALALARAAQALSEAEEARRAALAPRGELRDTYLRYQWGGTVAPAWLLRTDFHQLALSAVEAVPGIANVDGTFASDGARGVVSVRAGAGGGGAARGFRAPLPLTDASGRLAWRRQGDSWQIGGDDLVMHYEDIHGRAAFRLVRLAGMGPPHLDLYADFADGNGAHAARYLPVTLKHDKAVSWLDRAIVDGRVTQGEARLYGWLNEFPFDRGDGAFDVNFHVVDGVLDYAPGWPRLRQIATDVRFIGRSLVLRASAAKAFDSDVIGAEVKVADLAGHPAVVVVNGSASSRRAPFVKNSVTISPAWRRAARAAAISRWACRSPSSRPACRGRSRSPTADSNCATWTSISPPSMADSVFTRAVCAAATSARGCSASPRWSRSAAKTRARRTRRCSRRRARQMPRRSRGDSCRRSRRGS